MVVYRYEAHITGDARSRTIESFYPLRVNDDVRTKDGAFKVKALALPVAQAALPIVLLERVPRG